MYQPKWHEYMLPELKFLSDGKIRTRWEIIDGVAFQMKLPPEVLSETIAFGETRYSNRMGWALTYLKQSGLIEQPKRGEYKITGLGLNFLSTNPKTMTEEDLKQFPGYQEFIKKHKEKNKNEVEVGLEEISPEEALSNAEKQIRQSVCDELLERVRNITPTEFEELIIDLLIKMNYGDPNDPKAGIRRGGAGDCGIDGVIKQDKLGLDTIYFQAKRYKENNIVSPHDVRDFIGSVSIEGSGSKKGIFITTSNFTQEGYLHAINSKDCKIILINGKKLSELMYEYGVGVSDYQTITIKKIDTDYFE